MRKQLGYLRDFIKSGVGTESEVRSRNIVTNSGRNNGHRNAEFRILFAVLGQGKDSLISLWTYSFLFSDDCQDSEFQIKNTSKPPMTSRACIFSCLRRAAISGNLPSGRVRLMPKKAPPCPTQPVTSDQPSGVTCSQVMNR